MVPLFFIIFNVFIPFAMYAMYFNSINTYIYKTVVICNHFRFHFILFYTCFNHINMPWCQQILTIFHSYSCIVPHSSSMSSLPAIFIWFQFLFVFNLLSMSFLLFQQLLASGYVQKFQHFWSLFFPTSYFLIHLQLHIQKNESTWI